MQPAYELSFLYLFSFFLSFNTLHDSPLLQQPVGFSLSLSLPFIWTIAPAPLWGVGRTWASWCGIYVREPSRQTLVARNHTESDLAIAGVYLSSMPAR